MKLILLIVPPVSEEENMRLRILHILIAFKKKCIKTVVRWLSSEVVYLKLH